MIQSNSAIVLVIALVAGFFTALYGVLCLLSFQAYALGRSGFSFIEGHRAAFFGLLALGLGLLLFAQCLGRIEKRYSKFNRYGSMAAFAAIGIGGIGYLLTSLS